MAMKIKAVDSLFFAIIHTKKGRLKTYFQTTFSSLASVSVKQSDRIQPRQSITAWNGSHTLFQRGLRLIEQRCVEGRVGHDFFDVVARFGEGDGFGVNRAF